MADVLHHRQYIYDMPPVALLQTIFLNEVLEQGVAHEETKGEKKKRDGNAGVTLLGRGSMCPAREPASDGQQAPAFCA